MVSIIFSQAGEPQGQTPRAENKPFQGLLINRQYQLFPHDAWQCNK